MKQKLRTGNCQPKVFIFGNLDLPEDSLPLRLLPELQKRFSQAVFLAQDPNEEWEIPEKLIVLDTVVGIHDIRFFDDLAKFQPPPRISLHDFDAYVNLRLLQKLGKLKEIKIIGIPPMMDANEALEKVTRLLHPNLL
ncbi:MAG: hypothetical protein COT39_03800 [Parcubacteria group bacterium CG08_land_8_20_14_0_20_48_21]|nr:MAG: hypothetical protein AUK21_02415 [Parcubacteria group bacterium CG2_30_48_51]PIS32585.1 MAG: hypothetical protein COT39_03800 [Parcubacteria group bacterium CG08_land_8_20_14_0_20_48_21]PIW78825.1 MAG: hypothetical protein COZ99_04275 [Parcubacteria group bacterium CG_4_8_14_3_um_filter_48_16]PIY77998.1 MAG: hypothetical protein COY83_02155 [Parcubacteria group bacterium CG_4_10_14_0_8_um_filter_48_154]PIZ77115.1 MAG: hypothetical protein COY03_03885 [bacterium CG_4_10_14_0_2_um_filter_